MARPAAVRLSDLEAAIGYEFSNQQRLHLALTHASVNARKKNQAVADNERLEFLGDRVLGLVIATRLYRMFPDEQEGQLALRFNNLVRKETCVEVAQEIDLGRYLFLGDSEAGKGRVNKKILGDACEALLGAIYLDGGFEAGADFIDRYWTSRMPAPGGKPVLDAKTALQEWAQARGLKTPHYRLETKTGPDHAPEFTIIAEIDGWPAVKASGASKREAEQTAAQMFLREQGVWKNE